MVTDKQHSGLTSGFGHQYINCPRQGSIGSSHHLKNQKSFIRYVSNVIHVAALSNAHCLSYESVSLVWFLVNPLHIVSDRKSVLKRPQICDQNIDLRNLHNLIIALHQVPDRTEAAAVDHYLSLPTESIFVLVSPWPPEYRLVFVLWWALGIPRGGICQLQLQLSMWWNSLRQWFPNCGPRLPTRWSAKIFGRAYFIFTILVLSTATHSRSVG